MASRGLTSIGILEIRIDLGRKYLEKLSQLPSRDWLQEYELYLANALSLPEALALAHPENYDLNSLSNVIRGPRQFDPEIGRERCRAEVIWLYNCEVQASAADHVFPYSLGGPTVGSNKLLLCRRHNEMKANDIHLYPWEKGEPEWLTHCLRAIRRLKTSFTG
jgi:hypothetical protein